MYCMNCGKEIPEGGDFCPACGNNAPRKTPAQPPMPVYPQPYPQVYPPQAYPPQAYPPPSPYQQQYPGFPPVQPGYQAYPAQPPQTMQPAYPPPVPQYYSPYPGYRPPVMVVPLANPLPKKPPMRQRIQERLDIYIRQAGENKWETGLSITAACLVVIGALAMMAGGL